MPANVQDVAPPPVTDVMLNNIFGGDVVRNVNESDNFRYLKSLAGQIADQTYSDYDTSVEQLGRNLKSLIGQKSVEMHMLGKLCTMNCDELRTYYADRFNNHDGRIFIESIDITEAGELVLRSRKIMMALIEAQEFEKNFIRLRKRIPETFFLRQSMVLTRIRKAMVFVLHYISTKKSAARHIKQSLKKNATFRAFSVDMDTVLRKLITLGVLTTEPRVKRRRVVHEVRPRVNEIRVVELRDTYFKLFFDNANADHKEFLETYQIIYPGAVLGN